MFLIAKYAMTILILGAGSITWLRVSQFRSGLEELNSWIRKREFERGARIKDFKENTEERRRLPVLWVPDQLLGISEDYEPPLLDPGLDELIEDSRFATLVSKNTWSGSYSRIEGYFPLNDPEVSPPQIVTTSPDKPRPDFSYGLKFHLFDGSEKFIWVRGGRVDDISEDGFRGLPLSYLCRYLRKAGRSIETEQ